MTDAIPLRPDPDERPVLTVRTPEDLLALAAVMLGFVPERSVVMLTFGAAEPFHARCDLPDDTADLPLVVESLLEPARRHRAERVAFVVFSDQQFLARRVASSLRDECAAVGIDLVEVLRADGARWYPALGGMPGLPEWGVPYDLTAHPFVAEAVLRGQVTHGSRDELAQTVRPDPQLQRQTVMVLTRHQPRRRRQRAELRGEGEWVEQLVRRHAEAGTIPEGQQLARLLRALQLPPVRDAAWSAIERHDAERHVALWRAVCRRTPAALLAPVASLLGWAAWQSGHGALAWCAHELAVAADADYRMARQLGQVLEHAVPPSAWDGHWDWRDGL